MLKMWRSHGVSCVVSLVTVSLALVCLLSGHAAASTGINSELSFEGKIVDSSGLNIPDGTYNMEFTIYTGCTDNTGTGCTTAWTEDYLDTGTNTGGVTFTSGTFQVNLGSICPFTSSTCGVNTNTAINWNSYPLYLSLQIGNNSACTLTLPNTFNANCSGDGVMSPYILLTSTPYSMNSNELGGLTSSQFVQLAQGLQTDASSGTNSIYINKTGTGNLLDLQSSGSDAFILTNSGDATFGANANHTLSVETAGSGAVGLHLTVAAGAAGTGGSALAGGNLVLQGGNGGGTNGNGGNVTIDAGNQNGSGTDGTISIGTNNASAITIGSTANTGTLTLGQSTPGRD